MSSSDNKTNTFYDKAYEYRDQQKMDSAFFYFYKAKDLFIQQHDSFGAGKCFTNLAIIQETKGDYFGSQESALSAMKYFDRKDTLQHNYLSINYNTLSVASSKMQNYKQAIEFYKQAIFFATDSLNRILYENNLAVTYKQEKEYSKAIPIFENLNTDPLVNNSPSVKSKTISNLAFTRWLQNPSYDPRAGFNKALKIRLAEKDNWGLNSSYSHLADYYTDKNKDSALFYAEKMYNVARMITSPDDEIEALQKLISLSDLAESKKFFKVYRRKNDSLQTSRNQAKNQFALIRYETEKNKADYLKAKTESSRRQNHIILQYFALGFSLIIITGLYLYLKRRQKTLRQEKLLEVKNTELKYSKKVHDKVANRIYQIMSQVENANTIDKNAVLFGLENVYEISRDISYDSHDINENQNYSEQLHHMLDSYASDSVTIIYLGNNEKLWEGVNFQMKTEAYLILQELMTNMKKHSQADKVFLKFTKEKSEINISYTDNGVGIKNHSPKNGLQNMENRINSINGKINFDTETNNLLKINISFPI